MDPLAAKFCPTVPRDTVVGPGSTTDINGHKYHNERGRDGKNKQPSTGSRQNQRNNREGDIEGNKIRGERRNNRTKHVGREKTPVYEEGIITDQSNCDVVDKKGKKHVNYLLNFSSYEQTQPRQHFIGGSRPGRANRNSRSGSHTPYSKERFLQANCQFLVADGGDFSTNQVNPDLPVPWDAIEQVRVFSYTEMACPICLQKPQAGKITKCGHVYCWTCLLHYLSLGDRIWRKCPICYECIYKKDMRSVTIVTRQLATVGQSIALNLVERERASTTVLPYGRLKDQIGTDIPLSSDPMGSVYCNLLRIPPQDVLDNIIKQEERELQVQLSDCNDIYSESEIPFIQEAMIALKAREKEIQIKLQAAEYVKSRISTITVKKSSEIATNPTMNSINSLSHRQSDAYADIPDHNTLVVTEQPIIKDPTSLCTDHSKQPNRAKQPTLNTNGTMLFYQAIDGQKIYIHGINTKCLAQEFGSLENCPSEISGTILELVEMVICEETRKRYHFLAHLPLATEFIMIELDLNKYLSPETHAMFADELNKRKQRRRSKINKERIEAKRLEQNNQKPVFNANDFANFPLARDSDPSPSDLKSFLSPVLLASSVAHDSDSSISSSPSFAQAAKGVNDFPSPLPTSTRHSNHTGIDMSGPLACTPPVAKWVVLDKPGSNGPKTTPLCVETGNDVFGDLDARLQ
eukprot:Ihof_evm1s326 gene=Ihof_evmTU1s326